MLNPMTNYELSSIALEGAVVVILIAEFWYDKWWNDRSQRMKRRAKEQKPKIQYEKEMD